MLLSFKFIHTLAVQPGATGSVLPQIHTHIHSLCTQAQRAFVTARIKDFEVDIVDDARVYTVTGRLGSVRLRDKSAEAVRCSNVVRTDGGQVRARV